MGEVIDFNKSKFCEMPEKGELVRRILDLVHEYDGAIGVADAIGCLEIAKLSLIYDGGDDE